MIGDESGADSLPVDLAGCIIIAAITAGLALYGIHTAMPLVDESIVDGQVHDAAKDCRSLLACSARDILDPCSPPGTSMTITFALPEDTEYVAFGADPDSDSPHRGTIYYKVHGTKKAVIVDEWAEFRGSGMPATITGGGKYEVCIELAFDPVTNKKLLVIRAAGARDGYIK